jgi:hypothetical protein
VDQDYDPCEHGMDSACCACEIAQLRRQAQADEEEIVLLQDLLRRYAQATAVPVPGAHEYLQARGLL